MSLQRTLWRRARLSDGMVAAIQQSQSQNPAARAKRRSRRWLLIALGCLGASSAALGLWLWTRPEEPVPPLLRGPVAESMSPPPSAASDPARMATDGTVPAPRAKLSPPPSAASAPEHAAPVQRPASPP
ncbi:MAG TPA: hypothetical protein VGI70_04530, partial [Polyangiales bacterium]